MVKKIENKFLIINEESIVSENYLSKNLVFLIKSINFSQNFKLK